MPVPVVHLIAAGNTGAMQRRLRLGREVLTLFLFRTVVLAMCAGFAGWIAPLRL